MSERTEKVEGESAWRCAVATLLSDSREKCIIHRAARRDGMGKTGAERDRKTLSGRESNGFSSEQAATVLTVFRRASLGMGYSLDSG